MACGNKGGENRKDQREGANEMFGISGSALLRRDIEKKKRGKKHRVKGFETEAVAEEVVVTYKTKNDNVEIPGRRRRRGEIIVVHVKTKNSYVVIFVG